MANLKEVRTRIQSVKSTQQITKAMKMVAASKLRKAQDAILLMRPYVQKLAGIMKNASANLEVSQKSVFSHERNVDKVLVVVITSDRGLCGAFNTNVVKASLNLVKDQFQEQFDKDQVWFLPIGKKAFDYFSKRDYQIIDTYHTIFQELSFARVKEIADFAMEGFRKGNFDQVEIVYNEFKNVATQILKTERFLPLAPVEPEETDVKQEYIFEPSVEYIIQELIPISLNVQFYSAILESNASEHGARMTAMGQATENAGELLNSLKLVYNRTRQAAITTEILEIVGGAEALGNS